MNNKILKLLIIIMYLVGFILIILSNINKNIYLAKIAMGIYILYGLVVFSLFIKKLMTKN